MYTVWWNDGIQRRQLLKKTETLSPVCPASKNSKWMYEFKTNRWIEMRSYLEHWNKLELSKLTTFCVVGTKFSLTLQFFPHFLHYIQIYFANFKIFKILVFFKVCYFSTSRRYVRFEIHTTTGCVVYSVWIQIWIWMKLKKNIEWSTPEFLLGAKTMSYDKWINKKL
jgi:hypothetical protein